ncbi:MAG: hypothetical protein WCO71_07075, partial [Pseudomonadota bacterium]
MNTPDLKPLANHQNQAPTPDRADTSAQNADNQEIRVSSRLPGFYELSIGERLAVVSGVAGLTDSERFHLGQFGSLNGELADVFIENAIGTFSLPLGVATNFVINGRDILVPMAVEESSVLAAASHGAKLARAGGGFKTSTTLPIMTGQVQLFLTSTCDFDTIL